LQGSSSWYRRIFVLYSILLNKIDMFETSRKQKEKRILNQHNEGYSIRDIAEQEHMSFRDIGAIIHSHQNQEATEHQIEQAHIASQAYSLFLKGKSPIEVAIEMKLRQPEVLDLYSEYLKLVQLDKLHSVYEEVKEDIEYFVKLFNLADSTTCTKAC
jgi:hypothetical protein